MKMTKPTTRLFTLSTLCIAGALFVGCGDDDVTPFDGGSPDAVTRDGGIDGGPLPDAGGDDAGPGDAGPGDAGPGDAGPGDAGPGDAGPGDAGPMDAGPMDAGPTCDTAMATTEIDAMNASAEGMVSLALTCGFVTYLKPSVEGDEPGFFVQASATGPGVFIQLDPAGTVAVGDQVSLTATEIAISGDLILVTAATDVTVLASGTDLTGFVQDLSAAADVVSALDSYISERVAITGTIAGNFRGAGTGYEAAAINTAGIMDDTDLLIRLPATVVAALPLNDGCEVTVDGVMGRFRTAAQITTYDAASVTGITCPAPAVTGAAATDATTVAVRFSSALDMASVMASGAQFTFDNGLTASAATVMGDSVVLTTSMQTVATTYTVTVAATVTDTLGTPVDAMMNTAMFDAFDDSALHLVINEVDYDQPGADDAEFVEIYNPTAAAIDLSNYTLYFINGNGSTVYGEVALTGMIPADGYLVVGDVDPAIMDVLFIMGSSIQNGGPDGVALVNTTANTLVDALSYEGSITDADIPVLGVVSLVEGTEATLDGTGGGSLSRLPNGVDTDEMGVDWGNGMPTPGLPNVAL